MDSSDLALLNSIPTPIFVLEPDSNHNIVYTGYNEAALSYSHFSESDLIGRTAKEVFPGEYGERAYRMHLEAYQSAKTKEYEVTLPLSGELRILKTRLKPVFDDKGYVIRLMGASMDVSLERELEKIQIQKQNIEVELQEFIYLAAHDLRSPMKKVRIFADMLREDFEDTGDGRLEIIGMLEKVAVESMSMVKSVLHHAEINGIAECIEQVSLPDLCTSILTTLDPEQNHESRVDTCSIYTDRVLLQTIIRNLIDNSIKHNPNVRVSLDISAKASSEGYFTTTLTDNGRGLHEPEKLFESNNTDRSKSGFGLLAIRTLVKNRGGDIQASASDKGTGLSVTVTLPGIVT